MNEEVKSSALSKIETNKAETKSTIRKNVIPITSLSDIGSIVGEIQSQLALLTGKAGGDVSPEFKALMEGYVNKANELEETKVKLQDTSNKYEAIKTEIINLRETNRSLVSELQLARDTLRKLEQELSGFQEKTKAKEEIYKEKINELLEETSSYEEKMLAIEEIYRNKIDDLENKLTESKDTLEKTRQELLDQSYDFKHIEQELIIQRDGLKKQLQEIDSVIKEQSEQLEFKAKEIEYKDAYLNQIVKQSTLDKLKKLSIKKESEESKRKTWFLK